jgi:hypothetical protein
VACYSKPGEGEQTSYDHTNADNEAGEGTWIVQSGPNGSVSQRSYGRELSKFAHIEPEVEFVGRGTRVPDGMGMWTLVGSMGGDDGCHSE